MKSSNNSKESICLARIVRKSSIRMGLFSKAILLIRKGTEKVYTITRTVTYLPGIGKTIIWMAKGYTYLQTVN